MDKVDNVDSTEDAEPSSTSEAKKECAICLEELDSNVKALECSHSYHERCIDMWLEKKGTCPTCRHVTKIGPRRLMIAARRQARRTRSYQLQSRSSRVQRLLERITEHTDE
ncbi:uncharacterized protein LOC115266171 [Aedes albopictus]|uniref:RING-type domain-containing protein n=1 Tax=Aedes albopictus TaxID=7160 RepID=A0ABM1XPM7_AEDAL|nr:ERAD-associated E3 ubiquitin-protein ligase HRD1A-like [Aedes albopictus]